MAIQVRPGRPGKTGTTLPHTHIPSPPQYDTPPPKKTHKTLFTHMHIPPKHRPLTHIPMPSNTPKSSFGAFCHMTNCRMARGTVSHLVSFLEGMWEMCNCPQGWAPCAHRAPSTPVAPSITVQILLTRTHSRFRHLACHASSLLNATDMPLWKAHDFSGLRL